MGWLISWKWLPALQRQLTAPTSWRNYWRTGWRISWWTVFKKSRNVWLFLISWLVMAIISGGIVWASGAVSQLVSQFIAVFMMTGLQLLAWLMFMGWWSCLWPETAIAGHSNWQTGLLTLTGLLFLISWLVMAIISGGIVWASGAVSQLVSQFIAVFMMTGLQLLAWLMFMGWWSCLWPETAIAGHSNWQTGLLTLTGLLFLISWLVMAIISGGIVWASGAVSQLVSQFIAVFMM
ncbi:hypothetical protein WP50_31245, partial [Lactiplantibacillus plantarum]